MGAFSDRCRKGSIKHPARLGFSLDSWRTEFNRCTNNTTEDRDLFDAGIWFHERFVCLRTISATIDLSCIDRSTFRKVVVAALNYQLHMTRWYLEARAEERGFHDGDLTDVDGFESVINAGRHVLAHKGPFSTTPTPIRQSHLDLVNVLLMLNIQYDNHDALFQKCLWQGWKVTKCHSKDVFGPGDDAKEKVRALAWQRYQWLITSRSRMLRESWKELDGPFKRYHSTYRWEACNVVRGGHWMNFELAHPKDVEERIPLLVEMFAVTQEAMFKPFLVERFPKIPHLDLNLLSESFAVLASLAHKLREGIKLIPFVPETVPLFCPLIEREQVNKTVTVSQGVEPDVASSVSQMFTYRGTAYDDLYLKPLVPIADHEYAMVLPPFVIPNTTWLMEHWMKEGGLDPAAKGKEYEKEVRKSLTTACRLATGEVLPEAVVLDKGLNEEEVDLIVRIGNKLLVGEIKCLNFPTRPEEVFNYERKLVAGADQALRKADRVRARMNTVMALFQKPFDCSRDVEVVPLVLTNVPLGVGQSFKDVPVTDLLILSNYLNSGQIDAYVELETPEGLLRHKEILTLYVTDREAEDNLQSYLRKPAAFTRNERFIKETSKEWLPLPGFKPAIGRRFDVVSQVRPRSEWGKSAPDPGQDQ
ncbi:MAG: hypothetical protein KF905_16685 [Flavobacteriales bacterium]|nr:hypothetical protein [Flavobacteriales bacterium]